VVVGPPSREAIGTLLFGVSSTRPATEREGFFEDVDAAVAYVRRHIGEARYRPPPNGEPLTEAQWHESGEPYDMWEWLVYDVPNRRWSMHDWPRTDRASDRKLLLFAAACCHRMWHLMDGRSRRAVEAAERAADAGASGEPAPEEEEASAVYRDALAAYHAAGQRRDSPEASSLATATAAAWVHSPLHSITVAQECTSAAGDALQMHAEAVAQTHLLRDAFGNPFRPDPDVTPWRTEEVVTLARRMYEGGQFDRMQELAAALRCAGCDDAAVLAHCGEDRPHVRGCWVVDLLLGKK
jgi:hypothetical protein